MAQRGVSGRHAGKGWTAMGSFVRPLGEAVAGFQRDADLGVAVQVFCGRN